MKKEEVEKIIEEFLKKHLQVYLTVESEPSDDLTRSYVSVEANICLYFPEEDRVVEIMTVKDVETV